MRVYYPFHPRNGEVLEVVGRQPNGGEPALVVRGVGSGARWIPEWMTQPAAAHLAIHDPPRLSLECLVALRHVLNVVLAPSVATESDAPCDRSGNV